MSFTQLRTSPQSSSVALKAGSVFALATAWIADRVARAQRRHVHLTQYKKLDGLPEYLLRDIGISRADVHAAKLGVLRGDF
ncbi:MAG: DUF1127 domain-containing protein [Pseudomonadota bacterium]